MSGLEFSWTSCCPLIHEHFKTMCHEEVVKISVSKQQMKYSIFPQEMEEMLQKLSSRLTSTPPSTSVKQLHWQVLICYPQQIYNHIYKSGVSDRVRKGSLHQIHLLKSLVSFLLHSFQKKDDFGTDTLAFVVCNLWMSKGNNNHRHLRIRDGHRLAELGSLSSGAKMAMKIFVKRVFTIFAPNAPFLRIIANLQK